MNLLIANNLLAEGADGAWMTYVFLGILVLAFIAMFVWQNRKQKKQQAEQEATKNAIRPGNKVKTIGGVCGIVVEVNPEESTFVMETGSEIAGKSYMKFDMQAIYQTDAKPEPSAENKDKGAKKQGKNEEPAQENATNATEEKIEEKSEEKTEDKSEEQK